MAVTPARLGKLYAPLVVLAAVQVLLVAVAPSGPPPDRSDQLTADAAAGPIDSAGETFVDETGAVVDAAGNPVSSSGAGGATTAGGGSSSSGASVAAGGPAANPKSGATNAASAAQDRSRCDPVGRQIGPTYYMPICSPVWKGGDNGGATMPGVTADKVNYLIYQQQGDAQVNAILGTQGLAATQQQTCDGREAFTKELNKRWEFYGRTLTPMDGPGANKGSTSEGNDCQFPFFLGRCRLTPPDPPCGRAEAEVIATMKPAFVVGGSGNTFYNELAKQGIVSFGGIEYPQNYYSEPDGLRYDVFMDGSRSMEMLTEYYCKKLVGKPVKWAGPDVLQFDGPVAPPPKRKVAILYPQNYGDPVFKLSAEIFLKGINGGACGSSGDAQGLPYESDINKAQQQSSAIVTTLKNEKVTTVVCFCDPIAPAFLTATMETQNYHPEQLMTGTGLIDYDVLGRLYHPNVWKYAFGLSHLQVPLPFNQSDATKAWRDAGNAGEPDATANLAWAYFSLAGTAIHSAGPKLTRETIKAGFFRAPVRGGWAETKGVPHYPAIKFQGPDDFTGIDDAREVYWCSGRISEIDGKPGSYAFVDNGHRYNMGEWPRGDPKVLPSVSC